MSLHLDMPLTISPQLPLRFSESVAGSWRIIYSTCEIEPELYATDSSSGRAIAARRSQSSCLRHIYRITGRLRRPMESWRYVVDDARCISIVA